MSKRYLVKKDEGLQNKLFHDILKGLKYRGYDMLVVGKDIFIPLKKGEFPDREIIGAEIIAFAQKNGQSVITNMDSMTRFTPWLE